jgi:small nuclear ribonucleoprotein (snRNP)-like protein
MSTYTDTKNRIKETINVAHHPGYLDDRVTIQKVRLLNEENEYWGTFKGTSELNNTVLSNSTIYNTILKDVVLSGRIEA